MKASRGVLLVALALLAIAALRDFARLGDALPWRQLYDFADFYCAGTALDRGADPYRYEPLHRCEHGVNASAPFRADPGRVIPAPLPPYDFPPFMLAAHVSFTTARTIAAIAILCAVAVAVAALALVDIPIDVAALALALPAGYVLLNAGQIVPFALAALALCGAALARKRDALAGVLAGLTLIEPHLGLPVCAAAFAWAPRSRAALVATCAALAAIAVAVAGLPAIGEYVSRVLPAQAAAESGYAYQYGFTYLLRALGMPQVPALALGDASYAAALVGGIWLGGSVARTLGRREIVAYLPAAFSVIGGPYVHMVDLPFAVPAALSLATHLRGRDEAVATVALCLLAVPWIPVWIAKKLLLASAFVVAMLLVRLRAHTLVAIATVAAIVVAIYVAELFPPAALVATTGAFPASALAQQAWAEYVAQLGPASSAWLAIKLPTWIALAALVAVSISVVRTRRSPQS